MSIDCLFKSLTSPGSNELLQSHNSLTFKLLKTVADFSQALATLHDKFGHELQMLVETFRKRNGELRKERLHRPNSLFQIWELFLQQVEVNSQQHGDISRNFNQNIGNGLIERVFHRKIESKKIFAHRERIEAILLKSNELLLKCHRDYCQAYALALTNPVQYMSEYIASHNVYVHQLQATNGMIHAYQTKTLPRLLEELEECHLDTSLSISSSLLESSELVSEKSNEQASGYQAIAAACRQANHKQDLAQFVKLAQSCGPGSELSSPSGAQALINSAAGSDDGNSLTSVDQKLLLSPIRYHQFQAPNLQGLDCHQFDTKNMQIVPTFKNEIAPDLSQPPAQQQPQLEKDREDLEEKIEKFEERIESLGKLLIRSSESRLHNKVNELQEELCQRRFDLWVAQIHLSAVRSQLQLFEYNYRPNNLGQSTYALLQQQQPDALTGASGGSDQASGNQVSSGSLLGLRKNVQVGGGASGGLASGVGGALSASSSSGGAGSGGSQLPGYRSKWIKAFKSLKESPGSSNANSSGSSSAVSVGAQNAVVQQKFGDDLQKQDHHHHHGQQQFLLENQHFFQEYTFKKIASCDVCKDFLRGHMRQGVKCKLCKISCHNDCQSKAHATIKCQQPKIKLLRRQKSAGELEVNNSDADSAQDTANERSIVGSRPDSIYQLIRQVLDAKKRSSAQPAAQQQHQYDSDHHLKVGTYGGSAALTNFSTGNLALANQNGKSVSTSALGSSTAASVDRWAVVMDLLAQSRAKDKEVATAEALGEPLGVGGAVKRHSKQLDKFKLAAKSAAAASKHQRHYQQQQQQQQQQPQQNSPTSLQQPHQQHGGLYAPDPSGQVAYLGAQLSHGPNLTMHSDQSQPLHLHHTKSLPIGQMAPNHHHHQPQPPPQQQQQQLQVALSGGQQPQYPPQASHQLLNIGAQQLQSTSAPHSPQRKRFNLRMKSFSLDSPESPSIVATIPGYPVTGSQQQQPSAHGSGGNLPSAELPVGGAPNQQIYGEQRVQQQQQQQLYQQQSANYHHQQAYLQQQYQYADEPTQQHHQSDNGQLSAYLRANNRSGQHYQHRHSYQNQQPQYQQHDSQQQQNPRPGQQSSSQSALNSVGLLDAGGKQRGAGSQTTDKKRASADNVAACELPQNLRNDYYDLNLSGSSSQQQQPTVSPPSPVSTTGAVPTALVGQQHQLGAHVVLYDYVAQRSDEIQLNAGQLVCVLDTSERDWWKVRALDGSNRIGFYPSTYLAQLYQNERPLQVAQTIQVSNGETCDKLLRGQIVIHTGKQMANTVTIRTVVGDSPNHYIQCPEKYLLEVSPEGG